MTIWWETAVGRLLRLLLTLDFVWEALSGNSKKIMKIGMVKACMHVNDDEI